MKGKNCKKICIQKARRNDYVTLNKTGNKVLSLKLKLYSIHIPTYFFKMFCLLKCKYFKSFNVYKSNLYSSYLMDGCCKNIFSLCYIDQQDRKITTRNKKKQCCSNSPLFSLWFNCFPYNTFFIFFDTFALIKRALHSFLRHYLWFLDPKLFIIGLKKLALIPIFVVIVFFGRNTNISCTFPRVKI